MPRSACRRTSTASPRDQARVRAAQSALERLAQSPLSRDAARSMLQRLLLPSPPRLEPVQPHRPRRPADALRHRRVEPAVHLALVDLDLADHARWRRNRSAPSSSRPRRRSRRGLVARRQADGDLAGRRLQLAELAEPRRPEHDLAVHDRRREGQRLPRLQHQLDRLGRRRGARRRRRPASRADASRRQLPQHVGQNAAVAEIFELVQRIDAADQRHALRLAVGAT